jgi:hypothetical protein
VLGGVEEFWVPIVIRVLSALLATILTAAALPDHAAWKLCMWVWYVHCALNIKGSIRYLTLNVFENDILL